MQERRGDFAGIRMIHILLSMTLPLYRAMEMDQVSSVKWAKVQARYENIEVA